MVSCVDIRANLSMQAPLIAAFLLGAVQGGIGSFEDSADIGVLWMEIGKTE